MSFNSHELKARSDHDVAPAMLRPYASNSPHRRRYSAAA